jgi:hypothetical protein
MGNEIERRAFDLAQLEVRAEGGSKPKIRGYAAVFDKQSEDLGGFKEIIDPGAFTDAIKRDDVRALFNHNPNYVLGRNKSGTLVLSEDKNGLAIEIDPPDTQFARDLLVSIERKDISQMSFAFRIDGKNGDRWEVDGKEVKPMEAFDSMWDGKKHDIVRHVVKARLYDVSPVTYPAYPQTTVKVRSVFAGAGLDYDALSDVMLRARLGTLTESDRLVVINARETLNSYIAVPALTTPEPDGQGATPQEGRVDRLEMMRRELELISQ